MPCSFWMIVVPAIALRILYWVYGHIAGKKQEEALAATTEKVGDPEVKKGTCPYHVVMNFLGYPVPEKKKPEESVPSESSTTNEGAKETSQLKTE